MIGASNPNARRLRLNSTDAERLLWHRLRNRQFAGYKLRRQATVGPYIVDFLCSEARLVIEGDGGQHNDKTDAKRTAFLSARGLRVLRFWNHDILANIEGVLEAILIALEEQEPSPSHRKSGGPLPLP